MRGAVQRDGATHDTRALAVIIMVVANHYLQKSAILACEAGGGLHRVVIREGEKGCKRATHVSTWPAQSDVAGDTAYLRAVICHMDEWACYMPYICVRVAIPSSLLAIALAPKKSAVHASTSARQHFSTPETR